MQRARDVSIKELLRALGLFELGLIACLPHAPACVVTDEAARVVEGLLARLVHLVCHVAVDEKRHDLPLLGAKAHGHVLDGVARAERLKDF
eukprot:scaffold315054_cov24-Tisochrysis_lutea.AAC.1